MIRHLSHRFQSVGRARPRWPALAAGDPIAPATLPLPVDQAEQRAAVAELVNDIARHFSMPSYCLPADGAGEGRDE